MKRLISLAAVLATLGAMSGPALAVHRDLPVGTVDAGGGSVTFISTPGITFYTAQGGTPVPGGGGHGFRCDLNTDACVGTPLL